MPVKASEGLRRWAFDSPTRVVLSMPILVDCPGCKRKLRVPDTAAGKRGKCPQCSSAIEVPDFAEDFPSFLPIDGDDDYAPIRVANARPPNVVPPTPPPPSGPLESHPWRFGFPHKLPGQFEFAQRVVVINFNMPFGSMISFLFRWTLAALIVWTAFAAVLFVIGLLVSILLTLFGLALGNPRR